MNSKEFYDTVRLMREAQKDYFNTHAQVHLQKAKKLEKAIDDEIKRVDKIEKSRASPKLF